MTNNEMDRYQDLPAGTYDVRIIGKRGEVTAHALTPGAGVVTTIETMMNIHGASLADIEVWHKI